MTPDASKMTAYVVVAQAWILGPQTTVVDGGPMKDCAAPMPASAIGSTDHARTGATNVGIFTP